MATQIIEYRQIIFSEEDLKTALRDFDGKQAEQKISGPIREISILNGDQDLRAHLKVDAQVGGRIETLELGVTFLGAALLSYCFKARIPIPKFSQKNITQVDNKLALEIRVNSSPDTAEH